MTKPTLDNPERLRKLLDLYNSNPTDPDIPYMVGILHFEMGNHADAICYLDKCLAQDPDYVYAYYHKARVCKSMGNRDDAIYLLGVGLHIADRLNEHRIANEFRDYIAKESIDGCN